MKILSLGFFVLFTLILGIREPRLPQNARPRLHRKSF